MKLVEIYFTLRSTDEIADDDYIIGEDDWLDIGNKQINRICHINIRNVPMQIIKMLLFFKKCDKCKLLFLHANPA